MSSLSIEECISEEKKREIAEEVFRQICEEKFRADAERIFSNAAYKAVWRVVDDMFDGKAAQMVADKIPSIIDSMTEFSVFRFKGFYEDSDSPGAVALRSAVESQKVSISARVAHLVRQISKQDLISIIEESDLTMQISTKKDGKI